MTINIANFIVIFDEDDVLYNLVEFESDRMSPRESAKNGQIGAHGLNLRSKTSGKHQIEHNLIVP